MSPPDPNPVDSTPSAVTAWVPSVAVVTAVGRHVVTSVSTLIVAAEAFHILSPDQGQSITDAISSIEKGIETGWGLVAAGLIVLMPVLAGFSATLKARFKRVAAVPGTKIVTTPAVAAAIATPKVLSSDTHDVVPVINVDAGKTEQGLMDAGIRGQ